MVNRTVLLCLLILSTSLYVTESKRFGGGRSSSRSSSSSWGKSWGGGSSYKPSSSSSSGSSYKPSSSSSGSSWWSSGSSYKPSSSWNTGSSSSGSSYKPSSGSSGSSWWSSGSSGSSYPSSSTGLSGSGTGSHGYPSSSSGLSGTGSGSHSYPSSSSGLSGSGRGSLGYPSSSSGLSGTGTGTRYPSSSSGLSGSGSASRHPSSGSESRTHSYPSGTGSGNNYASSGSGSGTHSYPSGTGLSGSGTGNQKYPSSGSGTHSYPSGTGLSGSGSGGSTWSNNNYGSNGNSYKPTHTYNTNTGYGSGYHPASYMPTYYHYPQHVYVTQYRDSGSRYSDLLTGLTLYNLGRSSGHYHDRYYYDDYYRNRYSSSTNNAYGNNNQPRDEAICTLRVKENVKVEMLKIPCEIVSTFTEGSEKINNPTETRINTTVCTTNSTVIKKTKPGDVVVNMSNFSNVSAVTVPPPTMLPAVNVTANVTALNMTTDMQVTNKINQTDESTTIPTTLTPPTISSESTTTLTAPTVTPSQNVSATNGTTPVSPQTSTVAVPIIPLANTTAKNTTDKPVIIANSSTNGSTTTRTVRVITSTEETVNVTVCRTESSVTDPLAVKGGTINPSAMVCSVDIKTRDAYFRHNVDCQVLMNYSKTTPPPSKPSPILPDREKLKSWLNKPPWWMSMFIAV